jgi:hypothetical protein
MDLQHRRMADPRQTGPVFSQGAGQRRASYYQPLLSDLDCDCASTESSCFDTCSFHFEPVRAQDIPLSRAAARASPRPARRGYM